MSKNLINIVVFLAGLAVVGWIGAGYAGTNPLALAVTLLIGVCYLAGALELLRYQQATSSMAKAVAGLAEAPGNLGTWLDQVPAGLRNAVRLRVEGERVGLPGPSLTPYLVGLLVLLGMLGTFLGMVVTLRGTGLALESSTDLAAIRASLAAPVKGLGFAFGTSIAGVATSAMLGLLAAMCRRERVHAAQLLDTKAATTLRVYSQSYQRDESFKLLQRQAEAMQQQAEAIPALTGQLQAMIKSMEAQSQALNDRQMASQDAFQGKAEAAYARLASVMEASMKDSVAQSARSAGEALQPVVQATMDSLSRETASLQDTVAQAVQRQLEGLTAGLQSATSDVANIWGEAVAGQQRASEAMAQDLRASLDRFAQTFEQRSADLLEGVSARLEASSGNLSQAWTDALSHQQQAGEKLAGDNLRALTAAAASFEQHSASLLRTLNQSHTALQTELASRDQQRLAAWTETLGAMGATLRQEWEQSGSQAAARQQEVNDALARTARDVATQAAAQASLLEGVSARMEAAANGVSEQWTRALVRQEEAGEKLAAGNQAALETATAAFGQQAAALLRALDQSHTELQSAFASRDQERLAAWTGSLTAMAAKLGEEWEQAGTQAALRQIEVSDALAQTARDITAQTQTQAGLLEDVSTRLETAAGSVTQAWTDAQARQEAVGKQLADENRQALETASAAFGQHSIELLQALDQSHAALQAALAANDEERLTAWTGKLSAMADALRAEWEQAGAQAASLQQQICDTLSLTAQDITAQTQAHAGETIAEIERLVHAASEAPRAAAEVIGELRQKLSDSMVRDNDMLQERNRLLETLGTLLDAVNHTAAEQRTAVDALVASSADMLERVGAQFTDKVDAETGKLAEVASLVTGSAVEMASLGESFGVAVQSFGESNDKLMAHLQRIEAALDKSIARGDEQLAYYVAQAREVVDLSLMSQKQIIENLQTLASQRATAGAETA